MANAIIHGMGLCIFAAGILAVTGGAHTVGGGLIGLGITMSMLSLPVLDD